MLYKKYTCSAKYKLVYKDMFFYMDDCAKNKRRKQKCEYKYNRDRDLLNNQGKVLC